MTEFGNIVSLEHVNLKQPDQRLATVFYVSGLGLTRDPYMMTGVKTCGSTPAGASCTCLRVIHSAFVAQSN